ncbi:MAG TPA: HAD family phosphatase [Solirubrobacteraceae bacterium]|nr:HAD family phosphatase [Solirubrobacteraceae bacterium]
MTARVVRGELALGAVDVLLCDADGTLFPSEEPAFEASATVTNRLLADLGIGLTFAPDELRRASAGRNFRATARNLAAAHGVTLRPGELERRVAEERGQVMAHLRRVLRPDRAVREPLAVLAARGLRLALVSSSALGRVAACLAATGLADVFPPEARFSAEDSLPVPTSKPDPAIYTLAGERLGASSTAALAVEDAVAGVQSAVAAGFGCVGNVQFVAPDERPARIEALRDAGVVAVVSSWSELAILLDGEPRSRP